MVRSVMAVLALAIFPGLTVAQEPALQASQWATLEEVVRFDFDEKNPATVTNRTEATVIAFGEVHQLYGLREVTIPDKISLDGLDIGDEYVAFYGDGSTEQVIGRLRVVLTEEETSSSEIVTVEGVVFQVGTTVYLDRKMR